MLIRNGSADEGECVSTEAFGWGLEMKVLTLGSSYTVSLAESLSNL